MPALDTAVCMISAPCSVGVDGEPPQDASMVAARNKRKNVLPKLFILPFPLIFYAELRPDTSTVADTPAYSVT